MLPALLDQKPEKTPGVLNHYDRAMAALGAALGSTKVEVVLASRDDLGYIKLRAKQIRDRVLLADATEFQMRVERHLGSLLIAAQAAGQLSGKGRPNKHEHRTTLAEIGVDLKLSMTARQAAALDQKAFDTLVSEMRAHMASKSAKLVSATFGVQKAKKHGPSRTRSSFDYELADGTPLGQVRLGKLRARVEHLHIELKILRAIDDRIGSADSLASVEEH